MTIKSHSLSFTDPGDERGHRYACPIPGAKANKEPTGDAFVENNICGGGGFLLGRHQLDGTGRVAWLFTFRKIQEILKMVSMKNFSNKMVKILKKNGQKYEKIVEILKNG